VSPTATPSAPPPSLLRRTAIALAICGVAIGVRYLLDPIFGAQHSFITSFVAVAITAYLAGPGLPTLLAIAVTYGAASWLFLPPRHSFALRRRRTATAAGFDLHLAKPPDPRELERILAA
jgi:K+-sensing histidine kinase KdpD